MRIEKTLLNKLKDEKLVNIIFLGIGACQYVGKLPTYWQFYLTKQYLKYLYKTDNQIVKYYFLVWHAHCLSISEFNYFFSLKLIKT